MNVLYPVSPARTPSKNPNVERLLSLQKSSKHISDADILSFAAEASAMKRMAKASITDENSNPNARSVSKRLFDISTCSKTTMGSYSPEATAASDLTQKQKLATTEESDNSDGDSDTENDEIDTALQAEKHVEQILQLVERSASKAMHRREERQQAAKLKLKDTTAAATSSTIFSSADGLEGGILTSNDDSAFDDHFGDHPDTPEAGGVEEIASFAHTEGNTAETQPSATSDVAAAAAAATAVSTADTTAEGIRDLVIAHIANILNTGSYEEILALHGIGQVRAMRILTARNAGHTFVSLQDLEEVGMNAKTIIKFLKSNAADIVS